MLTTPTSELVNFRTRLALVAVAELIKEITDQIWPWSARANAGGSFLGGEHVAGESRLKIGNEAFHLFTRIDRRNIIGLWPLDGQAFRGDSDQSMRHCLTFCHVLSLHLLLSGSPASNRSVDL